MATENKKIIKKVVSKVKKTAITPVILSVRRRSHGTY
jgi:hypothetical protein